MPLLILLTVFILQFLFLDSDPSPLKRFGDVGDEGYWVHNARCAVLFDDPLPDDLNQSLHGSPVFFALEYLSFRLFGVSFFAARLVSLICFQLVLIELFILFWMRFESPWAGLAAAVILGVCHDALVLAKWATPITAEMLFLTSVLFFWEVGRLTGRSGFLVLSGLSWPIAVLAKLSSALFLPVLGLFFVTEVVVRKRLTSRLTWAALTGLILGCAILVVFLFVNHDGVAALDRNLGGAELRHLPEHGEAASWFFDRFVRRSVSLVMPSAHVTVMRSAGSGFVSLAAVGFLLSLLGKIRSEGLRATLSTLGSHQTFAMLWLFAFPATLIVAGSSTADRRMAPIMVPLVILAADFLVRGIARNRGNRHGASGCPENGTRSSRFWVVLISTAAAWHIVRCAQTVIERRWLEPGGLSSPFTDVAATCISLVLVAVLAGTVVVGIRQYAFTLLTMLLAVNLGLDAVWYSRSTFTVRDASRRLGASLDEGEILSGCLAHWLAIESRALPIWFNIDEQWVDHPRTIGVWNSGFLSTVRKYETSLVVLAPDEAPVGGVSSKFLRPERFPHHDATLLDDFRLAPFPFSEVFRMHTSAIRVEPSRDPQKETLR